MLGAQQTLSGVPAGAPPVPVSAQPPQPVPQNTAPQSGPAPASATQAQQPSLFRRILMGALAGIAAPAQEEQAKIEQAKAQTQVAQAQAQAIPQQTAISQQNANTEQMRAQNEQVLDQANAAMAHANYAKTMQTVSLMAPDRQTMLRDAWAQRMQNQIDAGGADLVVGDTDMGSALSQSNALNAKDQYYSYKPVPSSTTEGQWNVVKVPRTNSSKPFTIDLANGKKFTFPPGTPWNTIYSAQQKAMQLQADEQLRVEIAEMQQQGANTRSHATTLRSTLTTLQRNLTTLQSGDAKNLEAQGILKDLGIEPNSQNAMQLAIAKTQQQIADTQKELQSIGMSVTPPNQADQPPSGMPVPTGWQATQQNGQWGITDGKSFRPYKGQVNAGSRPVRTSGAAPNSANTGSSGGGF